MAVQLTPKQAAQKRYKEMRTVWLIQMVRKHEKKPDPAGIDYAERLNEFTAKQPSP